MDNPAQSPKIAPVIEYGRRTPGKLSLWAIASPFVAVAAFLLACFMGLYLADSSFVLVCLVTTFCSLASVAFGVYSIKRVRHSRGRLVGSILAALAILFSLTTGLLCPGFANSLQISQHISNINYTNAHLREIVRACQAYADAHKNAFPAHLAVLLAERTVKPDQLLDRNAPIKLQPFPESRLAPGVDWRSLATDVEAHCDFTYVGADLKNPQDSDIIVLYTKPGRIHNHFDPTNDAVDGHGRLVAYSDSHAEFVLDASLPAAFAQSNAARARLGLPPVTLDGPALRP